MSAEPQKPRPVPTAETKPFWDGCARGELLIQRCETCGKTQFPPRSFCVHCRGLSLTWIRSAGRGVVHSVTVARRAPVPAFKADLPYAIALIDLEEGVRLMMNVRGGDPAAVAIGQPVEIVFEDQGEGVVLPQARMVG